MWRPRIHPTSAGDVNSFPDHQPTLPMEAPKTADHRAAPTVGGQSEAGCADSYGCRPCRPRRSSRTPVSVPYSDAGHAAGTPPRLNTVMLPRIEDLRVILQHVIADRAERGYEVAGLRERVAAAPSSYDELAAIHRWTRRRAGRTGRTWSPMTWRRSGPSVRSCRWTRCSPSTLPLPAGAQQPGSWGRYAVACWASRRRPRAGSGRAGDEFVPGMSSRH